MKIIQYYSILFNRVLRPDYGDAIPEPILEAFLQPDIEFPPFAPAETDGRPRARDEDDETSGAPGELWLQMMLQAQAEIGADANANKLTRRVVERAQDQASMERAQTQGKEATTAEQAQIGAQ